MRLSILAACALLLLFFFSCGSPEQEKIPAKKVNKEVLKNQFIKANQQVVQKENDDMDSYERQHKLSFVRRNSGIRYYVTKPSLKGDSIRDGDVITIDFTVSLLDGKECYSSETTGARTFKVGQDHVESGIHKGIQYLKRGDKAILLIPSYLAHGLLGDMKSIPPQMPLVVEVQIHQS
jgi:FKBP-type peptidyl-prolyl cis-trans isomerase FkpA